MKHLWDKGQVWPLFATTAAYAMYTFASEALNGFSPFQLVFVHGPPDLTSLSFPKMIQLQLHIENTVIYYWQEHKWLVDYYLIGELNKHLNLKIETDNLQRKRFLKMIKWYTC